jgi:CBS domain-containing protein
MSTCPLLLEEGDLLADALKAIERHGVAATVIDASGSLKGLLLRRDARHAIRHGAGGSSTVGDVCWRRISVGPDDSIHAALAVMEAKRVNQLPVVDGRIPIGFVSRNDLERRLEPPQRSRARWRAVVPNEALTWGKELSGEAFIAKADSYGAFGVDKAILEIGPGYGRLLRECHRRKMPFRKYVAVDISPSNANYLSENFERGDVHVVVGDIETVVLNERFDAVISSLTFKHLYPSFETALRNVEQHLNDGATVIFDLMEGDSEGAFDPVGGISYIRSYPRAEVEEILSRIPLELVAFDEVEHDLEQVRLLVVARKLLDG